MLCMHFKLLDLIATVLHMNQIYHTYLSVCVTVMHGCAIICLRRLGDNLWKLVLPFHQEKPGDGAHMVRSGHESSCWIIFTLLITTLDLLIYSQQDSKLPDGPIACHFILCL